MPSTAEQHLNFCDAIAFGRWFLANPDLPQRIKVRCGHNFGLLLASLEHDIVIVDVFW